MVSNLYIDNILKTFPSFKGTFSSDNILLLEDNESIICNFSKEKEEGSHFVFIIFKDKTLYYFDSLGLPFIPQDVSNYFSNYSNVSNISKPIQHPTSIFCGFFCILAFLACNLDVDFFVKDILKLFKINNLQNDNLCIKMIQELFPLSLKKIKKIYR